MAMVLAVNFLLLVIAQAAGPSKPVMRSELGSAPNRQIPYDVGDGLHMNGDNQLHPSQGLNVANAVSKPVIRSEDVSPKPRLVAQNHSHAVSVLEVQKASLKESCDETGSDYCDPLAGCRQLGTWGTTKQPGEPGWSKMGQAYHQGAEQECSKGHFWDWGSGGCQYATCPPKTVTNTGDQMPGYGKATEWPASCPCKVVLCSCTTPNNGGKNEYTCKSGFKGSCTAEGEGKACSTGIEFAADEVDKVCKVLITEADEEKWQDKSRRLDGDANGCISSIEAEAGRLDKKMFKKMDQNQDGKVCKDDYSQMVQTGETNDAWEKFLLDDKSAAERGIMATRAVFCLIVASLSLAL